MESKLTQETKENFLKIGNEIDSMMTDTEIKNKIVIPHLQKHIWKCACYEWFLGKYQLLKNDTKRNVTKQFTCEILMIKFIS